MFGPDSECNTTKLTNHGTLRRKVVKVKKAKIWFLLVTIVSMIVAASMVSLASAQQPEAQAKSTSNPSGFPLKAPPLGWDQKEWDSIRKSCNDIASKARAHQALDLAERGQTATCMSVSRELMNLHSTPAPGAYISPDRPAPLPLQDRPRTPQCDECKPCAQGASRYFSSFRNFLATSSG